MKGRLAPLLALAALVVGALLVVPRLEVETDITHFLPEGDDPRMAEVARNVAASELNRTVSIVIDTDPPALAPAIARDLAARLEDNEDVAWVRSGPDSAIQEDFYSLYFPRRLGFAVEARTDDAALLERAQALKAQLALPTSPFTREIATQDPFLLFPEHLERLANELRGILRVEDGAFMTEDGGAVLFMASKRSPFDVDASRRLLASLDAANVPGLRGHGELSLSAIHRFAVRGEETTKADIMRVSIAGTLGVLFFLFVIFRSFRYLLVGHVPIAAGVASALIATYFVFDKIHGLTLAFGATLIGVTIDYVAHYLNHHVLSPDPAGAEATMRRIWPGLLLGGVTTIAGIAGLGGTGFPAIQEMAFFTSVGVFGALVATRWAMPPFLPDAPTPTRFHLALAERVSRALGALAARRRLLVAIPVFALLLIVGGLSRLSFLDDVRVLGAMPEDLLAADEAVRERVARVDAGRFVVAFGDDLEGALAVNDRVHQVLGDAIDDGLVARQRSLSSLLPSVETQRARQAVFTDDESLVARTEAAFADEGFVPGAFSAFAESIDAPYAPLTLEDIEGTAVAPMIAPFLLDVDGDAAVLTFVHGVTDPDALAARLGDVEGALWFDQGAYMGEAYRRFRTSVEVLLAVGLVLVFLLILGRYRSLRRALAAFLPAAGAGAATLGAVSLLGFPITLIHVVTLLLVLSMGVDYGVFMVESERYDEGPVPTVVSLLVACASTVLSFGALAMSDQPALRAMGLTTAIGVLLSLLFAPAAWLLLGRSGQLGSGPRASKP